MNDEVQQATFRGFQAAPGGWSFILNNIEVTHSLPFQIAPGICFNRASNDQIDKIKGKLRSLLGDGHLGVDQHYEWTFEAPLCKLDTPIPTQLPKDKWRYYIVETDDLGHKNIDLQYAAYTSLMPIDISSMHFMNNGGMGWRGGSLHYHFLGKTVEAPDVIDSTKLNDLADSYKQYINVTGGIIGTSQFPEIRRALGLLDNLSLIPKSSEFHILGLFAIIEMLITHNPKLEDRGDSITHQMKSKIPLLSKRFKNKIESKTFFGNASEEKIWSQLYKYRSAIAHGGVVDFSNDFQLLKNPEMAKMFLLSVVRKMIRHAFSEPDLYKDLRTC